MRFSLFLPLAAASPASPARWARTAARAVKNNASLDIYSDKATKRGRGLTEEMRKEKTTGPRARRSAAIAPRESCERARNARSSDPRDAGSTEGGREEGREGERGGERERERERERRETAGRRG